MAVQGPMTELSAVNLMLRAINETPRDTLSGDTSLDVTLARTILAETTREVLAMKWWFNHDENYSLSPNGDDEIELPANAISISPEESEAYAGLVEREGKFWSITSQTYEIARAVLVEVVWGFDFEDLNHEAQRYIAFKAARKFAAAARNKPETNEGTEEALALAELQRRHLEEMRRRGLNMVGPRFAREFRL